MNRTARVTGRHLSACLTRVRYVSGRCCHALAPDYLTLSNDLNKFLRRVYGYELKDLWVFAIPARSPRPRWILTTEAAPGYDRRAFYLGSGRTAGTCVR